MFLRIEYIIGKSFFVHNLHIGTKTRLYGFFCKVRYWYNVFFLSLWQEGLQIIIYQNHNCILLE